MQRGRPAPGRLGAVLRRPPRRFPTPPPLLPVFVSFEGIDGSGKSTQARLLADALRQRGQTVVEVREPGGTDVGERIRRLVLDPDAWVDSRAELLLFSAARAQLVAEVVRPALAEGATVIADRYTDSSTAYQGGGREIESVDWFKAHHDFVTGGLLPDRTYLIDIAPAKAAERRGQRNADRMEREGAAYYDRVRGVYRQLAERYRDRFVLLDGSLSVEGLHGQVLADFDVRQLTS